MRFYDKLYIVTRGSTMKISENKQHHFLRTHQVFNTDEWERHCSLTGHHSRNQLARLTRTDKIRKIRNCLYSVVPEGVKHDFTPPALLTAAKLTPDAVLGYRSALSFYGMSRNTHSSHTFLSQHRLKPCTVNDTLFQPCLPPKSLSTNDAFVVEHRMWNTPVKVVSKERLLVDLLDRMELSGGWEEITNAFMYETDLDWKNVLAYAKMLNHPATNARLGFMLEKFQNSMLVPEETLTALEALTPKNPEHFFRSNRRGKFLKRWNLYVPEEMINSAEDENYEF